MGKTANKEIDRSIRMLRECNNKIFDLEDRKYIEDGSVDVTALDEIIIQLERNKKWKR